MNCVGFWRPRSQGFVLEKWDLKALRDEIVVLVLRLMMVEKETLVFKSHTNCNNAILNYGIMGGGGGGGGRVGVTISRLPYPVLPPPVFFCPFVSRLPLFIVFLPLSCKSPCLTPYSNMECFGQLASLSKIKNCVVNRTTSHSLARSLK